MHTSDSPPEYEELARIRTETKTSYPIVSGLDASAMLLGSWHPAWKQAAIIGDTNTTRLFARSLTAALEPRCDRVLVLSFPAGEQHKTRETKQALEDKLLAAGFDRSCCIVAVGGGLVLDVAGFVAATYLRGVAHINIATTLLAQVDAGIGGKTGVNAPQGKNLIGAFHHPRAVLIDTAALRSLPAQEHQNGLAEVTKCAVVGDRDLFAQLELWADSLPNTLPPAQVSSCVVLKAKVVEADQYEQGYRQVLNFGHTVGHALETASNHRLSHGQAVAIGLVVEARLAQRICGFPEAHVVRLTRLLTKIGLPTEPPLSFELARSCFLHDKKTQEGVVGCALPERIGRMHMHGEAHVTPIVLSDLRSVWNGHGEHEDGARG